jgi:hypothetical protein
MRGLSASKSTVKPLSLKLSAVWFSIIVATRYLMVRPRDTLPVAIDDGDALKI